MTVPAVMTLGELCDPTNLQVSPQQLQETTYLGLEHLGSGRFLPLGHGRATDVQSAKSTFAPGDVLYGKLRPYLAKAVLADRPGVCSTELLVLRPRPGISGRFLTCVVHSPDFVRHAVAGTTGAHHPRTSWHHIREFAIVSFTQIEQEEIANLAWKVHFMMVVSEQALDAAYQLKKAVTRELFTRGMKGEAQKETPFGAVPESWAIHSLRDISVVQTGAAKGRKIDEADAIEVPYLRVANVQNGYLDLSVMKTLRIRRAEVERFRLRSGDVVLTEGGDFDKLGRGFIWRDELPLCIHQNHVFTVRPNGVVLIPDFFAYLAQSPYGRAYFLRVAHKTTNLACINSNKLKAFPVPIPPLDEQRSIVDILDAVDQKVRAHKRKRAVLDDLFRALLHKLMTGEVRVSDLDLTALDVAT